MNMGMLGALGGLGEGMKSYAATMKENKKQEQLEAMEKVKYERQLHMQELSNKQARALQQDDHTFQSNLYGQKLEDTRKVQQDQNEWTLKRDGALQGNAIDLLREKNALNKQDREDAATFNTQKRQEEWNQIVEQGTLEGRSEKEVEMLRLSVLHPEVYKTIAAANKLDKFPAEEYQRQYAKSLEAFPSLNKNEKKKYQDMAANLGIDPLEAASLYATRQAMIGTGQANMLQEGQRNLTAREAALEEKNFKKVMANRDSVEASDAEGFTDPEKKAEILAIAKENEKKKSGGGGISHEPTTAAPVDSSPNIEGRVMSGLGGILSNTSGALQNYKERNFRASQANRGE